MAADRRRALLTAALGFTQVRHQPPEVAPLRRWLDTWTGIGAITTGMARQGFDVALTSDAQGWRATFLHRSHLTQPWVGQVLRWWTTPWQAVEDAAWHALNATPRRIIEESPP